MLLLCPLIVATPPPLAAPCTLTADRMKKESSPSYFKTKTANFYRGICLCARYEPATEKRWKTLLKNVYLYSSANIWYKLLPGVAAAWPLMLFAFLYSIYPLTNSGHYYGVICCTALQCRVCLLFSTLDFFWIRPSLSRKTSPGRWFVKVLFKTNEKAANQSFQLFDRLLSDLG